MVKMPTKPKSTPPARDTCIGKFVEWWSVDQMRQIMSELDPGTATILNLNNHIDHTTMAGYLYDLVGSRFLKDIDNDVKKRRMFLKAILEAVTKKRLVRETDIIDTARRITEDGRIGTIHDVVHQDMSSKLCSGLARELALPTSVTINDRITRPPQTEIVEPHAPINPLYDYQYSTGMLVKDMLEGKCKDKDGQDILRRLIAVPTGSGKTRMIVQTLIQWLNDGKPSSEPQRKNSKFILWVAQSGELCEQAISTFRTVFESKGRRGTTLRLHRFWGKKATLPKMGMADMLDDRSVMVATIQSLHKILGKNPDQLEALGRLTSCIVIDEAHHSITPSYSSVLQKMGFNWKNRKTEISEWKIVLIGLTATPFRGSGDNKETERLKRRYGDIYFPVIPYIQDSTNYRPHALIDCQTSARAGEDVHILGEQSYDRDGFIRESDYFWNIRRLGPNAHNGADLSNWSRRHEWLLQGDKNVTFKFQEPGTYKITFKVIDNEGDYGYNSTKIKIIEQSETNEDDESEQQKRLYRRLIKRKILCEVYHRVLKTAHTVDLDKKDEEHLEKFGEFRTKTLKNISESPERNRLILDEIARLREIGKKKILFFGCSVEHSRRIALYLKMQGIGARYVDSKMGASSRAEAIEEFRSSDLGVLCNFGVLTTGFDAPNIDCVFVGRPVKSTLLYTQMIGRGMRGVKSGGTDDVMIVDIDDNFQLQDKSTVQLGWKIYEPYWEKTEEIDHISSMRVPRETPELAFDEKEPKPSDAISPFELACSACGAKASGIEEISATFGIEGPPDILAKHLEDEPYDTIPSECYKCRTERNESTTGADAITTTKNSATRQRRRDMSQVERAIDATLPPASEQMLWKHFDDIISHGRKSNTYKFALAAYLLCHAGSENAGLTVRYTDIASGFLTYYWPQVIKYKIKQSASGQHPPRAVKAIRKRFRGYRGELADMPVEAVRDATSDILRDVFGNAKRGTSMVIPRFQVTGTGSQFAEKRVFYTYSDAKKILTLRPEALAFFRKNQIALLGKVFEGWARFLVRVNAPKSLTTLVMKHRGRESTPPDDSKLITEPDQVSCFVCDADIKPGEIRLYPVMPWSYVFESEMWSPVPLCHICRDNTNDQQAGIEMIGRLIKSGHKFTHMHLACVNLPRRTPP